MGYFFFFNAFRIFYATNYTNSGTKETEKPRLIKCAVEQSRGKTIKK